MSNLYLEPQPAPTPETFDSTPFDQARADSQVYWHLPAKYVVTRIIHGGRPSLKLTLQGEAPASGDGVHALHFLGGDVGIIAAPPWNFNSVSLAQDVQDVSRLGGFQATIRRFPNQVLFELVMRHRQGNRLLVNGNALSNLPIPLADGDTLTTVSHAPVTYRVSIA